MEGDSQLSINDVCNGHIHNWKLKSRVLQIKDCIEKLGNIQITHIYQKSKKAADFFANKGVELADGDYIIKNGDNWPGLSLILDEDSRIVAILNQDRVG